jgi:hypothetical protein
MALQKDETTSAGRGRSLDTHPPGQVLYRSNFDQGFDGWVSHWGGIPAQPWPPISRTTEMCYRGSHSLMISTGEHASPVSNDISNEGYAVKRMYRYDNYRYFHFSAFIALGIGNYDATWKSIVFQIDTQAQDNSIRSLYDIECVAMSSPNFSKWSLRGNNTGGTPPQFNVNNPDTSLFTHSLIGENESKRGFQYVRWTIDMQANSGLGGYKELQVGQKVVDLSGQGAGPSSEPPQWDGTNPITDFAGGFNIAVGIIRNTATAGGCQLYFDDVVLSASNTL